MESVACLNVDISKFLSSEESTTERREVKWTCSDCLLKMLEEGIYSDITFGATDGGSVRAHRSVLTCVCPLLCEDVEYDSKEHLKAPTQFGIVIMSIDTLKLFLILLYTTNGDDAVEVPQLRCAIDKHFNELYKAVREYNVEKRLGFVLLPAMARQLTPDNCWYYYESSLIAKHVPYKISSCETCYNYILGNYAEVILSESFLEQMKRTRYYYESSLIAKHVPYKISSCETCYNYILGNYAEVILSESFLEQMKRTTRKCTVL